MNRKGISCAYANRLTAWERGYRARDVDVSKTRRRQKRTRDDVVSSRFGTHAYGNIRTRVDPTATSEATSDASTSCANGTRVGGKRGLADSVYVQDK